MGNCLPSIRGPNWLAGQAVPILLMQRRPDAKDIRRGCSDTADAKRRCAVRMKVKNVSNAYMLVYVRISDWDSVMCDAGAEHLMEHVSKRLKAEQADKERKRREKLQAHRFVTLKIVTEEDIRYAQCSSSLHNR